MRARLDVTPKPTEQNRIVRTGKFEVVVTNNEKLRSRYCTIEAMKLTTDRYEAARGLFATAELLVYCTLLLSQRRPVFPRRGQLRQLVHVVLGLQHWLVPRISRL